MTSKAYQYFHYSAFGETLVQEDVNYGKFDAPWRFNGKELDGETRNYYYGARYYNPTWSVWLGVDPLASRDPHMTPYHFVYNNPMIYVDPNGLHGYRVGDDGGIERIDAEAHPAEVASGGDDFDVLYSNDLQRTAPGTFDPGTFEMKTDETLRTPDGPVSVQTIDFSDNCEDQARGSWEFLRKESSTGQNAGIEYTLTTGEKNGATRSSLSVSRNQVGVEYGYKRAILRLMYNDYTNIISSHFHPNNTGPSGYGLNGDKTIGGDKKAISELTEFLIKKGKPIPVMRVDNYDGSLYEYDSKAAKKVR